MSDRAPLAGFLILWLKRCVVPTLPYGVIVTDVVYPAILHAHGKSIALLPIMVAGSRVGYDTNEELLSGGGNHGHKGQPSQGFQWSSPS